MTNPTIWFFFANSAEHRAISTRNPRKRLSSMKGKTYVWAEAVCHLHSLSCHYLYQLEYFLVFLAFYAPTRGKIPSDVHQDRIKSITNLCCFPIHVGLVLEVSLMDVNHLRLFFGSEIPICLKVENILHILSKNASQVARNKLR